MRVARLSSFQRRLDVKKKPSWQVAVDDRVERLRELADGSTDSDV